MVVGGMIRLSVLKIVLGLAVLFIKLIVDPLTAVSIAGVKLLSLMLM